ncbi:MAG: hypothetical protein ABEK10_03590 [Candidatus Nanosalina sp.]
MKKLALVPAILAMLACTTAFTASMTSVKPTASPGSPAIFHIQVQNNASHPQRYSLSHEFSKNGWLYYETSKTINPGQKKIFNVTVTPGDTAIQQSYNLAMTVTQVSTEEMKTFSDLIKVQRQNLINVKNVNFSKTSVKPGRTVRTSITVQNLASRIISDYRVSSSMGGTLREASGIPFAPGALKTYTFSYRFPEKTPPGNRTLKIWVEYSGNYQNFSETVKVEEIRNITRSSEETNRGLYVSGSVTVENNGNSEVNISEKMSFPEYIDPILDFSKEPSETTENGSETVYYWRQVIDPGEKLRISYEVHYWMPLALAVVITLAIILLRKITGNVKITKTSKKIENDRKKISIEIENRSSSAKGVIKIQDFVPNVFNLDEDFEMTRPELRRTTDGVELEWNLEDFKPGEKRVITYEVEQKVEVEEGVDLPPAEIVENGKTVSKSS